jgi:hypothetical protein
MTNPGDAKPARRNLKPTLSGVEQRRAESNQENSESGNQEKGRAVAVAVPAANAFPQATRLPLQPIFPGACVTVGTSIFVLFVTLCASSLSAEKYESERQEDRNGQNLQNRDPYFLLSCFLNSFL